MPQFSWGRLRWIPVLPWKVHVCPYIFLRSLLCLYNGSWEGEKLDKLHVVYGYTHLAIQRHLNCYQAATDDIPSSLSLLSSSYLNCLQGLFGVHPVL